VRWSILKEEDTVCEGVKEEIRFYTEVFKTAIFLLVATAGGTVGLLLKIDNRLALLLAFIGCILEIVWAFWTVSTYLRVKNLLRELK